MRKREVTSSNPIGRVTAKFVQKMLGLGKDDFADNIFAECPLPSVAFGKAFAECNRKSGSHSSYLSLNIYPQLYGINITCPLLISFSLARSLCPIPGNSACADPSTIAAVAHLRSDRLKGPNG